MVLKGDLLHLLQRDRGGVVVVRASWFAAVAARLLINLASSERCLCRVGSRTERSLEFYRSEEAEAEPEDAGFGFGHRKVCWTWRR